jgi:phage terminase large subunit-like protein
MKGGPKPAPSVADLPPLKSTAPAKRVLEFFETHLRHTAGAKAGTPLRLAPWQRNEIITPLFGTLGRDGRRQYRSAFVSMPRRNGKSSLAAGVALYLLFADDEPGSYVVSAAANREQARVVFDQAARMVESAPHLRAMAQVYRGEIVIPSTGSRYKVLSRDSKVQHGMDLHGVVIDELHAHRDPDLFRVLTSSTGSRRQPLTFVITTASDDEHSIATEVYRYSQQVLEGAIDDPTWLAVIYATPEGADPWSEATWRACNPALRSGFRSLAELRTAALQARAVPAREATFRQLYLNQWGTTAAPRWLPLAAWDACVAPGSTISDGAAMSPRRAFLGLDLASTTDLTALVTVIEDGDDLEVRADFWCPEDNLAERGRRDHVPYELWAKQGHLTPTPGNTVDYSFIEARIHALMAAHEVVEVAVDPWNARPLLAKLAQDQVPAIAVAQTMAGLTAASKELERRILSRTLRHDGHPILRWCVGNTVADVDGNGNLKPSKKRSHERIDGVSALVTALARALVQPRTTSAYEEHRLVFV